MHKGSGDDHRYVSHKSGNCSESCTELRPVREILAGEQQRPGPSSRKVAKQRRCITSKTVWVSFHDFFFF